MTRHPALHGARSFVTLARGIDLLDGEELLSAYGSAFDGGDDATLLIAAQEADAEMIAARNPARVVRAPEDVE